MAVCVAAWCERLLQQPLLIPDTAAGGEAALGAAGFPQVSVSEHPVAGLGLRGGSLGPAVGRGLRGASCEGAREQHSSY